MNRSNQIAQRAASLLFALVVAVSMWPATALAAPKATATPAPTWKDTYDASKPGALKDADLQGASCVAIDSATGRILYDKNAKTKRYPASTTKIMTLLLAVEYGHLNDMITIPDEVKQIPGDSSLTPVFPGEQMKFVDLLYGMMMRSGNDAANAVAVIVGGSIPNFVHMMNLRAQEIGCEKTAFVNPHGYHAPEHYSTAYDLALIAREGLKHKEFRDIVSAKSYTIAITNPQVDPKREKFRLDTSYSIYVANNKDYYPPANGIKTGYHSVSGQCFVGSATKDGVTLITATLKTTRDGRWMDTKRLCEYGFPKFRALSFDDLYNQSPKYASVENASRNDSGKGMLALTAVPGGSINSYKKYTLPEDFDEAVRLFADNTRVEYTSRLQAPVLEGDIIGKLVMDQPGGERLETTLIASRDVRMETGISSLTELFPSLSEDSLAPAKLALGALGALSALMIALRVYIVNKRNRRRREAYRRRMQAIERYRSYR